MEKKFNKKQCKKCRAIKFWKNGRWIYYGAGHGINITSKTKCKHEWQEKQ